VANSISRLAVIFTADTSQLQRGAAQAGQIIGQLQNNTAAMASRTSGIIDGALSVATGTLIAGRARMLGRAMANFARTGLGAAGDFREARNQIVADYDAMMGASGKWIAQYGDDVDTFRGQAAKFRENMGQIFLPAESAMREIAKVGNMMAESLIKSFRSADFDRQQNAIEMMAKALEKAAEETARLEAEQQAASEAFQRRMDQMRSAADGFTKALRTPGEIFADTMQQLNELSYVGLISLETFQRGTAKARQDLQDSLKITKQMQQISRPSAGAAERFTSAGMSAISMGREELRRIEALEKQQLEIEKQQKTLLEQATRALVSIEQKPAFIGGRL
jgi:hypothetical protein